MEHNESIGEMEDFTARDYGIFIYRVNPRGTLTLESWSNQLALPPAETFSAGDIEELMRLQNGYYFVIKRSVDLFTYPVVVYAMIPVRSDFFLQTEYLPQKFVYSNTADKREDK